MGKDISEILRLASEKNESERRNADFEKTKVVELKKPLPVAVREKEEVKTKLDAETIELIGKYSEKKPEESTADTRILRDSLASTMPDDTDLREYIAPERPIPKSRKVDSLYAILNDAKTKTNSDAKKHSPSVTVDESRLTDEAEIEVPKVYEQEEMFELGDTLTLKNEPTEHSTAHYDEDYDRLSYDSINGIVEMEEENDERQLRMVAEEPPMAGALDKTEIDLRLAFDMLDGAEGDLDEFIDKNNMLIKSAGKKQEYDSIRYTNRSQNREITGVLKKRRRKALVRFLLALLFTAAIAFVEIIGGKSIQELRSSYYGAMIYILADMQLLCFIAIALLPSLKKGISGIAHLRLNTESLTVVSIFFALAYSCVLLFSENVTSQAHLYCLPSAFCALCSALATWLKTRKDSETFKIISSKRPKYAACAIGANSCEANEFTKYLFDDSELYTVRKTGFVNGFMERIEKRPKSEDLFNFLVPVIFLAGVVLFAVMSLIGYSSSDAFTAFSVLIIASVPSTAFFMSTLPLVSANRVGMRHGTAFVGNCVPEEYASASVLSFADTEVYPSNLVNITSIRTYGDYRIDLIIPNIAKIFSHLGGPLAGVLKNTLDGQVEPPRNIRMIENAYDGICVAMDSRQYFMGKRSYMRRYRFDAPVDSGDDIYEKSVGSIMYVVIDEQIAAKLYIKYTINPLFDRLLRDMYKAGLCLGVKTLDPNITNELLSAGIHFRKCPIAVLKAVSSDELAGECESADSAVACNTGLHNFLKMFALCDKTRHVTRGNAIISIVSVLLSFFAVFFLAITGDIGAIGANYAVAFQVFWLLPVWLISFLL